MASIVSAVAVTRLSSLCLGAGLLFGCSATAPESQYPPAGPSGGLPYIPFPEVNDLDDEEIDDDDEASGGSEAGAPNPGSQASVSAELPSSIPLLGAVSECKAKTCLLKDWIPDPSWANLPGKAPAGAESRVDTPAMGPLDSPALLWSEKLPKGNTLVLPRHQHLEYYLLGSSGKALVTGDDGGAPKALGSWTLARIPGGGASVRATEDSVILIAALTPKESIKEAIEAARAKPWEVRWKKRSAAIETSQLNELSAVPNQGGSLQVRLTLPSSARRVGALQILVGGPDMRVPEHKHATEWEHVAILQGAGEMPFGKASEGKAMTLKAGDVVRLSPGDLHSFRGTGAKPVVALQIYSPPGPEARFAAKPASDQPPPAGDSKKPSDKPTEKAKAAPAPAPSAAKK
ncbi:MAG: cupin domain-containing protein [Polyangiaceae bacterium]|nr:cupin domain-containing protein [Myxococcales bacterium]MCB9584801.1 cupin domain-containing protein [Polyangiaceae bacterium]MCB9607626.1 cupin domain-containing protein [Polyangiaceae bacterium]